MPFPTMFPISVFFNWNHTYSSHGYVLTVAIISFARLEPTGADNCRRLPTGLCGRIPTPSIRQHPDWDIGVVFPIADSTTSLKQSSSSAMATSAFVAVQATSESCMCREGRHSLTQRLLKTPFPRSVVKSSIYTEQMHTHCRAGPTTFISSQKVVLVGLDCRSSVRCSTHTQNFRLTVVYAAADAHFRNSLPVVMRAQNL